MRKKLTALLLACLLLVCLVLPVSAADAPALYLSLIHILSVSLPSSVATVSKF